MAADIAQQSCNLELAPKGGSVYVEEAPREDPVAYAVVGLPGDYEISVLTHAHGRSLLKDGISIDPELTPCRKAVAPAETASEDSVASAAAAVPHDVKVRWRNNA